MYDLPYIQRSRRNLCDVFAVLIGERWSDQISHFLSRSSYQTTLGYPGSTGGASSSHIHVPDYSGHPYSTDGASSSHLPSFGYQDTTPYMPEATGLPAYGFSAWASAHPPMYQADQPPRPSRLPSSLPTGRQLHFSQGSLTREDFDSSDEEEEEEDRGRGGRRGHRGGGGGGSGKRKGGGGGGGNRGGGGEHVTKGGRQIFPRRCGTRGHLI